MSWFKASSQRSSEEDQLAARIEALLEAYRGKPDVALEFDRLLTLTHADSTAALALALQKLVQHGKLKRIVRVQSTKNKGGIQDFATIDEVPPEIFDWRLGKDVEVEKENVRIFFAPV